MYPLIIIGNGIAAQTLLFFLKKNNVPLNKICQITADNLAPPASLNNTGLTSSMGIQKGISPLGDILSQSWDFFTKWMEDNQPTGVYQGEHHFLSLEKNSLEKLTKRFGKLDTISSIAKKNLKEPLFGKTIPAYLIDPGVYLSWFKKRSEEVFLIKDMVCKVERKKQDWIVHTLGKKQISGKILVVACGAFLKIGQEIFMKKHFAQTKVVAGSFLQFKNLSFSSFNFAISLGDFNLICRKGSLLLGATSQGPILAPSLSKLKEFYRLIPSSLGENFTLPSLEQGKIISAYRHKGKKRLLFWGEMENHLYGIHSLYKNGLSTSLLAANQLAKVLVKRL